MDPRRWSDDLPPDVLREIAVRLHVTADFVRFHAVCKPWRDSRDSLTPKKQFLPWLLAPAGKHHDPFKLRCVFSKSSYRVQSLPPQRTWVASADGGALGYLTVGMIRPRLHDPLTGAITDLPPFPRGNRNWGENPCGIVYGDGTTLLYTVSFNRRITRFSAALLRPGHNNWTLVDRSIQCTGSQGKFCAAYHRGRIFFTAENYRWHVITAADTQVWKPLSMGGEQQHNYILESHGELLWAAVQVPPIYTHTHTVSVLVHALEEDASAPEKMRWIRKDSRSLADRVLFLGSPNSFAVDASLLGGHGGCVYFVYHNGKALMRSNEKFGVFRYNLIDKKTKFMERLPREWDNEKCTWLIPQQIVAPIIQLEPNNRKLETPKLKKQPQLTRIIQT